MNTWKGITFISAIVSILLGPYLLNDEELWITLIATPIVTIAILIYLYGTFLVIAIDTLSGKIVAVVLFIIYGGFAIALLGKYWLHSLPTNIILFTQGIAVVYLLWLVIQYGNTKEWWIHIIHPSLPPRMKSGVMLFGFVVSCLCVALTLTLQNSSILPYKEAAVFINRYWFISYPLPLVLSMLVFISYNMFAERKNNNV